MILRAHGSSSSGIRRLQMKILARDGVCPGPGGIERAFHGEAIHRRIARDVQPIDGGPQERLDEIVLLGVAAQNGRRCNRVWARPSPADEPSSCLSSSAPNSPGFAVILRNSSWPPAVTRRTCCPSTLISIWCGSSMPRIRSKVLRHSRSLMTYSASSGEVVLHQHAAARAERQPFDVLVLRKIGPNAIGGRRRRDVHVAHGLPADVPGSRQIALHQRRRHAQDVGDVVEAAALVVGGQQSGRIHVQSQQVVDRIGILGAIQPMHGGVSGIRFGGGRAIERSLQKRCQRVGRWSVRPRHSLRRHGARCAACESPFPRSRRPPEHCLSRHPAARARRYAAFRYGR